MIRVQAGVRQTDLFIYNNVYYFLVLVWKGQIFKIIYLGSNIINFLSRNSSY
jgi:hypothetical protein